MHHDGSDFITTYTVYDSKERPVTGSQDASSLKPECYDIPVTITYDDANRVRVSDYTPADMTNCNAWDYTLTETYDKNGNTLRHQVSNTGLDIQYTITETDETCD